MYQLKTILVKSIYLTSVIFLLFALNSCKEGNEKRDSGNNLSDSSGADNDALSKKYNLDKIKLPPGFKISIYAEVPSARSICISPNGTVFVGTRNDKVYAITDKNNDGKGDKVYELASGLTAPNGVAFKDGSLYIGARTTIYRIDNIESNLDNPPKPIAVYDQYPSDSHHGLRFIGFAPDGKLYVGVGAPCNICEPSKPIYASISRMNPDGSGFEIFARGIRNTVGFDWDTTNGQIWFTDNGRDNLGDDIPSDELNTAPQPGMNFGFPYCHQGNIPDPDFGKGKNCNDYTAPVKLLGAHVASLGMRFNKGGTFPGEYKNAIFIAEHGSWNRSIPIGYRIAVVKKDSSGNYENPQIFADGWLQNNKDVLGRPVDVQFLKDGSMLVSDDFNGVIYRITYGKKF